jgi:hypothetical protein
MTCVLDLEGIALEQLVAFTALLFLLYSLEYFVAYAATVLSSSSVDLSCSDSCTRGFFTSGSAGYLLSYRAAPAVELFISFLGSP